MMAAWNAAAWTAARMAGVRVGDLSQILSDLDEEEPSAPPSPDVVWSAMLDWAAQQRGVRIERHESPVM
jgi:hypothetical protein